MKTTIVTTARLVPVLAAVLIAGPARAEDLERQLLQQAPRVLQYLKEKGCRNVGVLKFRVQKGKAAATDNAGTLNLSLARRLEVALVLANDVRAQVGILRDASSVAARLPGANHLTVEGRRALFSGKYPLAWGDQQVEPDAFVTGLVQVDDALRTLKVGLMAFDKEGARLEKVTQFTAGMDAVALAETGESYLLRGGLDGGQVEVVQNQVVETAARVKDRQEKFPLGDPTAPIALEICYDGEPVPVEIHGGRALVREPHQGQKVTFTLSHRKTSRDTFGMVLKVNGENTLYRQREKDLYCRKWILDPTDPPTVLQGFQTSEKEAEQFRVLSRAESKAKEMNYGADVGTITLTVFRARGKKPKDEPPVDLSDAAEDQLAMSRGLLPSRAPNLSALKRKLRDDGSRGLIEAGGKTAFEVQTVKFEPDPVPVMTATITYYKP